MTASKNRSTSPRLETLEDRLTPSASWTISGGGDLVVHGSSANDHISVSYTADGRNYALSNEHGVITHVIPGGYVNGGDVILYGYDGHDYLNNNTWLRTVAHGHAGDDTLLGSYDNDTLDGGSGSDYIAGYGGNDILRGGSDDSRDSDTLYGGDGNDFLYGGFGNDTLNAGAGNDELWGSLGNDRLYGGYGNDFLYGESGLDKLYGEEDNDYLHGGWDGQWDHLYGGSGNDFFESDIQYFWGYYGRYSKNVDGHYTDYGQSGSDVRR